METLTLDRDGRVLVIGLNRPAKRNAFDRTMLRELATALHEYEVDDALWCAVILAHGDHFTAGLDLAEVGPAVAAGEDLFPPDILDPLNLDGHRVKPVVIGTQGWCLTIGIELMLACDIRLCATGTRFRQMEVNRGILPFGGATLRFPKMAGWGNAMRYLLTGDEFGAEDALRMGLVCEVTAPEQLRDRTLELAHRVAAAAPLGVQATLRNARIAERDGDLRALHALMDETRRLMASEDAAEGVRSFVERREARFQGR